MNIGVPSHWRFAAAFVAVFFVSSVALYAIDFVPEKPAVEGTVAGATDIEAMTPEEPVTISIKAIGVDTPVLNPTTTSVTYLDQELLRGAVRYPTSARLGETGTVYLFGHQSYLPVVKNKAFKAFNDLQKLHEGDTIMVSSATADYEYRVTSVMLTTAADIVPLESVGHTLVLSTCNSFGSNREERYVVTADFVVRMPRS